MKERLLNLGMFVLYLAAFVFVVWDISQKGIWGPP